MRYIRPLAGTGLADAPQVGRKAAVLGDLAAAGFRVPPGFTVTIERPPVEELVAALAELGDGPVAVRSSGVNEDLADRSFAGQYESVLNVRGPVEVLEAIRTCWASASSARVVAYGGEPGDMAVLVQCMVDADAAGAAFSANPVTGDAGEVLISAVTGLAEGLMNGERSADEWRVRDGRASRVPAGVDAITEGQAREVADLARAVAEHYGAPQDIEWAYGEGKLFLLQARPITASAAPAIEQLPIPIEEPPAFSVRDGSVVRPWTRLQTSLFLPVFSDASRHVFRFTTGAIPYASSIGGWVYLTMPPVDAAVQLDRLERIGARLAAGEPRALIERWNADWKPDFRDRLTTLRAVTPADLGDDALGNHLGELLALFRRLHDVYFRITGASVALLAELGVAARGLLGWTPSETLRLRGGLEGDHMAVATGLSALARLSFDDPSFEREFEAYRLAFCRRTIGFDLTEPTLAEQPDVLRNLIRAQLDDPFDLDRERARLQKRRADVLADVPSDERFAAALAASDLATPVRDEKVFYAVSLWALLRYALLDLGARLAAAGRLEKPDDIWHLHLDTALSALDRGADLHEEVRLGRGRHAWAVAHPGPPTYGPPPVAMDITDFSPAAGYAAEVAEWSMSLWSGGGPGGVSDGVLRGLGASAGRYTGPARVIRDVTEFGKLRRGDVLVCPETTSQWAVLFPSVGALVTDRGSVLSHPAIISREYGVPAVLATGNATETVTDGQLVTVDGTAGVVQLVTLLEGVPA